MHSLIIVCDRPLHWSNSHESRAQFDVFHWSLDVVIFFRLATDQRNQFHHWESYQIVHENRKIECYCYIYTPMVEYDFRLVDFLRCSNDKTTWDRNFHLEYVVNSSFHVLPIKNTTADDNIFWICIIRTIAFDWLRLVSQFALSSIFLVTARFEFSKVNVELNAGKYLSFFLNTDTRP